MFRRPGVHLLAGGLALFLMVGVGACGGSSDTSGADAAESTGADESAGSGPVDDEVKDDIAECLDTQIQDPALAAAVENSDTSALDDAQIQTLLTVVGGCSAKGLGFSGPAAACLQKAFTAAVAGYPDTRALAAEVMSGGDTAQLEQAVMQAAMSPQVCTAEERQAILSGTSVPASD